MYRVAQCWDDGNVSDIFVAETCRKYGAKATFNICPGTNEKSKRLFRRRWKDFDIVRLSLDEMPSVYENFQVASHTMTHPHPLEISPGEFRKEACDAKKYVEDVWRREARGFAWPFGQYSPELIQILRESGFAYGRTCENSDHVGACEPLALASSCHFQNPDFDAIREKARKSGILYFWGHSYEMLDSPELHARYEDLIRSISSDPEAVWCDVIDLVK